jgi:hypothetical protein
MSGHSDGIGPGVKTRGGKPVIVRTALARGDQRPAIAMKKRASSSKTPSVAPNASNNVSMEVEAAETAIKCSRKKGATAASKKKSKQSAEDTIRVPLVEATTQPPKSGDSTDPVNPSNNYDTEVAAAENAPKRLRKKGATAASKNKSKKSAEGVI